MKCKYSINDIISYTEKASSLQESDSFYEHLKVCEKCRRAYSVLHFADDYLTGKAVMDSSVHSKIMDGIDKNRYSKRSLTFRTGAVLEKLRPFLKPAAISLAALALTLVIVQSRHDIAGYISSTFNNLQEKIRVSDKGSLKNENENKNEYTPLENEGLEDINAEELVQKIKEEIINWPTLKLFALDASYEITLTGQQKQALSEKLTSIYGIERFEGGITPLREAIYPFYILQFAPNSAEGSNISGYAGYSFTVAGSNLLLVNIPDEKKTYFSLDKSIIPVRFIKVNSEFIDQIKALLPPPPNNDKSSWNYLLSAKEINLIARSVSAPPSATGTAQQVQKCARTLRNAAGKEIALADLPKDAAKAADFSFIFEDGSIITVELTDKYIQFNNRYYEVDGNADHILSGLFAAYF